MNISIRWRFALAAFAVAAVWTLWPHSARGGSAPVPEAAPEFTQRSPDAWINSAPLKIGALRGSVVLLDIWTFECWNCYRSFPWLNTLEGRFAPQGLRVVGIHSPEFEREHDRSMIVARAQKFGLHHAIMIDNDMGYWNALNNNYWPAYYLLDKQGRIRYRFYGETHAGDRQALAIESAVTQLLSE